MDLDLLFQKGELIPAIIQEASTGQVLMLAYMNRESLEKNPRHRVYMVLQPLPPSALE